MGILTEIIAHKREELIATQRQMPFDEIKARVADLPNRTPSSLRAALSEPGVSIIAEIKEKSPSGGVLRPDLEPSAMARTYEKNGARAISVLTDKKFFGGSIGILQDIRVNTRLPILRKEFIIHPYQIYESGWILADAILLIVRILSDEQLIDFIRLAQELGLECLVEVHTEAELERAITAGAQIIGVNNRNLETLEISLDTSIQLRKLIPAGCVAVSESGIRQASDIVRLREAGFDTFLIGETLMRQPDPGQKLRELIEAGLE